MNKIVSRKNAPKPNSESVDFFGFIFEKSPALFCVGLFMAFFISKMREKTQLACFFLAQLEREKSCLNATESHLRICAHANRSESKSPVSDVSLDVGV